MTKIEIISSDCGDDDVLWTMEIKDEDITEDGKILKCKIVIKKENTDDYYLDEH